MPSISVLIKPASGECNMRCKYCFYADEAANRSTKSFGIMTPSVQEAITRRILSHASGSCTIAFQGGEPTLAGLDFYRHQAALETQYNINHVTIHHSIQSNGLIIDDEWADFFSKNNYLVGISLDGSKELHDVNRVDAAGKGTYNRVIHALAILKKHKVSCNVLSVLTEQNARAIRRTYGFFHRSGYLWQQYIPCLDPLGEKPGGHDYSLTAEGFSFYLKTIFDCWYQDAIKGHLYYHRYFSNLLALLAGQPPEACDMNGVCSCQYVIEADGSVYPCDFYMLDEWKLGSLITDSFEQLNQKRKDLRFVELSKEALSTCQSCQWFPLCRGGCRRNRETTLGQPLGENCFCSAYREFFPYVLPRLRKILTLIQNGQLQLPME